MLFVVFVCSGAVCACVYVACFCGSLKYLWYAASAAPTMASSAMTMPAMRAELGPDGDAGVVPVLELTA